MKKILTRIGIAGAGLAIALTGLGAMSASALSPQTSSASDPSTFIAPLHSLNNSGVTGFVRLSLNNSQPGATLNVSAFAHGAAPNQIHAMHIHGMLNGQPVECPTTSADTNHDNLISVFEGAPFYGPIKVNFTDPPTTFGPPSRTELFAPFAGVPNPNNFPHSNANGNFRYNQIIPFDVNNQYAVEALSSITPLTAQHVVIHGGYAPESVDTLGGSPTKIVYDPLLPIACGPIIQTHQGSGNNEGSGTVTITSTGPGSINTITENSSSSVDTTNNNNVNVSNQSSQTSSSGNAKVNGSTYSGSAISGNASNSASNSFMVEIMNQDANN